MYGLVDTLNLMQVDASSKKQQQEEEEEEEDGEELAGEGQSGGRSRDRPRRWWLVGRNLGASPQQSIINQSINTYDVPYHTPNPRSDACP